MAGLNTAKRAVLMCLGPDPGGGFEVRDAPRRAPGADEIEVAVEAAAVNPIDVGRAAGYGRRLLSLMGASRFPMTLGNDFAGTIVALGSRAPDFSVGDRVYGVKPVSRDGSHSSYIVVKADWGRKAPRQRNLDALAALPYSFVTMWLAARAAGLTRQSAPGKSVLVHGAAGGLGTLALETLSAWGARATAVAKASDLKSCLAAGAAEAVDRGQNPFAALRGRSTPRSISPRGTTSARCSAVCANARPGTRPRFTRCCGTSTNTDGSAAPGARCSTKGGSGRRCRREPADMLGFSSGLKRKRWPKWRAWSTRGGLPFRSEFASPCPTAARPSNTCAGDRRDAR